MVTITGFSITQDFRVDSGPSPSGVLQILNEQHCAPALAEKKTGDRNNANFITHIDAKVGDKVVLDASTSQFLSKNPIFKFKFKGADFKKGDELVMTWVDLKGNTKTSKAAIK